VIDETLALLDDYSEPDELQKIWERPDRDDYIQEQLENPSETSIIAKIKSKELSFLAKNSLESVNHLRFYLFVLSFNGLKLAEFCKRRKIPYSGTKGTKSVLLVQYYFAPWEEAIGELENFAYNGYNKNKGGGKASEVLKNRLGDKYSIWDIFGAYIGEDIISKWVKYTNQKASIMLGMKERPHYYSTKFCWPPKYFSKWKPVDVEELKLWLMVLLGKNSLAGVPRSLFWRDSSGRFAPDFKKISSLMSRDRWCAISSFFCIYNTTEAENQSPIWKVREILKHINQKFAENYVPGMGGNDCGDMMRSRISCHKKSRKWWKGIFYYVIDQVLICCYKIWNEIAGKNKQMCMRRMVEEIIGCVAAEPSVYGNDGEITETVRETQPKKRRRLNEEGLSDTRLSGFYKHESSVQGKRQNCVLCYLRFKKEVRTKYFCSSCNVSLCFRFDRNCHEEYHRSKNLV